jgi:hypothetical protein
MKALFNGEEPGMANKRIVRIAMTGMLFAAFTLGYVCGSVSQPPHASAQLPGGILDKATQGGGPLAAAGQLGSSITDMEQHVTGLQKNLDTLKKIQSALTGK